MGISYSHLEKLISGKTKLGCKTYEKLKALCSLKGEDIENLLVPLPLGFMEEILVMKNGELIASITSRDIVVKEEYEVVCVPY